MEPRTAYNRGVKHTAHETFSSGLRRPVAARKALLKKGPQKNFQLAGGGVHLQCLMSKKSPQKSSHSDPACLSLVSQNLARDLACV